jgi:hypothetical protein
MRRSAVEVGMPEWLPTDDPRLSRVKQKRGARRRVLGWGLI